MNIDFKFESYINTNPIVLKFKDVTKIIKFQNTQIKQTNKNKKTIDIFDTVNIDKTLLSTTIKDNEITFDKLVLYANTPINLLIKLLSSVLKVSLINISIKLKQSFKVPFNVYSSYLCVGKDSLELDINDVFKSEYADYSDDFLKWYSLNNDFINNIDTTKQPFKTNHNFTTYEIVFYPKSKRFCDLLELFNLHYTAFKFKRVIIHDSNLCTYNNDEKVQYIKNLKTYSVNTKHVIGKQNTLTLMYLCDVSDEICLESIDIYHDSTFKLNFIVSHNLTLDEFNEIINDYFNKSLDDLFEMLMIAYTTYSHEAKLKKLTIKDYFQMPGKFDSTYLIKNVKAKNIDKIKKLLTLDGIVSRFSSNTSLAIMSFAFINESLIYQFNNNFINKETINDNMTKINLLPEIHFTFGDNDLTIFCNKFYSIDELIFILSFTIPLIDYGNDIDDNDNNDSIENKILNRVKNIPVKQNLKQLVATDPELFAPRVVGKNPRAYSALCQSKEQRPAIISNSEYEILKDKYPESIMKLQNQTYPEQALYLVCPYETYPILNFHHFNNQKCIVRCTTKQTNISQFITCSKDLNAEVLSINTSFNHQSQSIIRFNDNLPKGRQCYLPTELSFLSDFVCVNVYDLPASQGETWQEYIKRVYGYVPLIIKRNTENKTYEVLTNYDFDSNFNYTLIIQPSDNPHTFYYLNNVINNKLLLIQEYKTLKEFFVSISKYDNKNIIWMTFINKLFGLNINIDNGIYVFMSEIENKGYRPVVKFGYIVGFVNLNEIFYLVPQIHLLINNPYKADYVLKCIQDGIFKYPDITKFELSDNDKYCLDITTNKITGIFWNSQNLMLCNVPDDSVKITKSNTIIYDTSKYIEFILLENSIEHIKAKNRVDEFTLIYKVALMLLKRFWYYNKSDDNLKARFLNYVNEFGILTTNETLLVKKTSKLINIYESKINKKAFEDSLNKIVFDYEIIDDLLFDVYEVELKLPHDEDKEVITKKYFIC